MISSNRLRGTPALWTVAVLFLALALVGGAVGFAGAGDVAADAGTIGPTVADANGTGTVLVSFDTGDVASASTVSIDRLEERAEAAQAPLERYAAETSGVTFERGFWLGNVAVVTVDHDRVDVEAIARLDGVEHVGPNPEEHVDAGVATLSAPDTAVTESGVKTTYGLAQIDAPAVWERAYGNGTSVAVLDTGVDPDHPDIDLAEWGEWDVYGLPKDTDPQDYSPHGHGTHVSGTVSGNNASDVHVGVAPGTELHHGAVLNECNEDGCVGWRSQIIAGMEWAVENDVDVISMSLGSSDYADEYIDPIRDARAAGTMVVASSGNDGEGTSGSPGNVYDSIAVGASDSSEGIAYFSSGEVVDRDDWDDPPEDWPEEYVVPTVAAPGSGVYSSLPDDDWGSLSGTSMAAPHVSGAIALLQSATETEFDGSEIQAALTETAFKPDGEDPEQDTRYGHGIVDVAAALDSLSAEFQLGSIDAPGTVEQDAGYHVAVDVTNVGVDAGTGTVSYELLDGNGTAVVDGGNQSVALNASESVSVTFEVDGNDTADLLGNYTHRVEIGNGTASLNLTVVEEIEIPEIDVTGDGEPATDTTGDGLLNDVNGDGEFSIFDVQALFSNVDEINEKYPEYTEHFDFSGQDDEQVTIFDVQALFGQLQNYGD